MSAPRRWMALFGLVIIPALVWLANPPNTDIPRYFLICGVVVSVVFAEAAGQCWTGTRHRWLVAVLLAAYATGQGALDLRLLAAGRGQPSAFVSVMATSPAATYAGPFSSAAQMPVDYYAFRRGVHLLRRVDRPIGCIDKPDWYIDDTSPNLDGKALAAITLGPDDCRTTYGQFLDGPSSSLSRRHWTLFKRRRDEAGRSWRSSAVGRDR